MPSYTVDTHGAIETMLAVGVEEKKALAIAKLLVDSYNTFIEKDIANIKAAAATLERAGFTREQALAIMQPLMTTRLCERRLLKTEEEIQAVREEVAEFMDGIRQSPR